MSEIWIADCRCDKCKYYHKLRELKKGQWLISGCCTKEVETLRSLGPEAVVIPVLENDYCDDFDRWKKP